jgi:hypothetical protein
MNIEKLKKDLEFTGLFLGEGYCAIVRYFEKRKYKNKVYEYWAYRPQLSLSQRGDNKEMLQWIKDNYGGNIWIQRTKKENQNISYHWSMTNIGKSLEICKILLSGVIPSKKLKSIQIVKDYCEWKLKRGLQVKMNEKDYLKAENWYKQCKENHAYNEEVT